MTPSETENIECDTKIPKKKRYISSVKRQKIIIYIYESNENSTNSKVAKQ